VVFGGLGEVVSVNIVTDRATGHPQGIDLVETVDETSAGQAISQLNGTTVDGRQIEFGDARDPDESGTPTGEATTVGSGSMPGPAGIRRR
jgi:RNA recognition motif-containing protein